jgi:hypothetical protein
MVIISAIFLCIGNLILKQNILLNHHHFNLEPKNRAKRLLSKAIFEKYKFVLIKG